jgi:hypothetical protein
LLQHFAACLGSVLYGKFSLLPCGLIRIFVLCVRICRSLHLLVYPIKCSLL